MCSRHDSHPPLPPLRGASSAHEHVTLTAADGNRCRAFRADATAAGGTGIVVLPDYHGLTGFYEELALRLAEVGIDSVAIDYYGRTAGSEARDASFDHITHAERTTWAGLQADVAAAAADLRGRRRVERLFSIGFCFGGRVSFLLATLPAMRMAGVIGFYGWPVGRYRNDMPAPADVAGQLAAPLLGIFGGADAKITAADVRRFEASLSGAGAAHRIVSYERAPHSFFDRQQDAFAEASAGAWSEVLDFIGLASGPERAGAR